jgi:hypothetical protein
VILRVDHERARLFGSTIGDQLAAEFRVQQFEIDLADLMRAVRYRLGKPFFRIDLLGLSRRGRMLTLKRWLDIARPAQRCRRPQRSLLDRHRLRECGRCGQRGARCREKMPAGHESVRPGRHS